MHQVTANLPADTKAPELDDAHAAVALKADAKSTGEDLSAGGAVTKDIVGVYLAYLIDLGFMPRPGGSGEKALPSITIGQKQKDVLAIVGGRTGTA